MATKPQETTTTASNTKSTRQTVAIATQVMHDLLRNPEFNDLLNNIVGQAVERKLEEKLEEKLGKFLNTVEELKGEVFDIQRNLEEKEHEIKHLQERMIQQQHTVQRVEAEMNRSEQYSRRSNIRIFGLAETKGENTDAIVADMITQKLGVLIDPSDIDRSHRTGRPHNPNEPASGPGPSSGTSSADRARPRPVIVRLTTHRKKREIILNRKKLKGTRIVIVEDLTLENLKLLAAARKTTGVTSAWSTDGRIIASIAASGGKHITKLITNEEDLNKLRKH